MIRIVVIAVSITTCAGCAGLGSSRWAMDDEVYAEKYDRAYSANAPEKLGRMIKQASDARYVADRGGCYWGAAGADEPFTAGVEVGRFMYTGPSLESRIGFKGLAGTGAHDWFAGGDLGLRFQSPSRLAPFVGAGTYLGANWRDVPAANDGIDNDGNGFIDEFGEKDSVSEFIASAYPELGVHFWMNSSTRLTANAQYHFTTEGRSSDFWFIGLSISFLDAYESFEELTEEDE